MDQFEIKTKQNQMPQHNAKKTREILNRNLIKRIIGNPKAQMIKNQIRRNWVLLLFF